MMLKVSVGLSICFIAYTADWRQMYRYIPGTNGLDASCKKKKKESNVEYMPNLWQGANNYVFIIENIVQCL